MHTAVKLHTEERCIEGFCEEFQRRPSAADFAGLWRAAGAIVFTLVPQAVEQFTTCGICMQTTPDLGLGAQLGFVELTALGTA